MKILIATTSADSLGPEHPTGTWLEEFAVPFNAFHASGAEITVASPRGGVTPIDPKTAPNEDQQREWKEALAALQSTHRLSEMNADDFDALFVPGGHGPMMDLTNDPDVLRLLTAFDRSGKVIGAVCHGPAALVNAVGGNGQPLIAGRRVTGFTNNEEKLVKLDQVVPFLLEDELKRHGAHFEGTPIPFAPHIVRDGNLITGQNPASSKEISERMLEALSSPAAP